MPEHLGLDWWRWVWGPALAAALVWLASVWKTTGDTRSARDARMDSRQDKELARLDAENEELRREYDILENQALAVHEFAHEQRHGYLEVISGLKALRQAVRGFLNGSVERADLDRALVEQGDPASPPKVPPLREKAAKRPD